MANHNATRTQRCSSLDVYTAKTPFRTHNGMKMAPPATTIHHSNTDVTAVTPTPSRNPNRSLASNTGQSERELKRTRGKFICLRHLRSYGIHFVLKALVRID